MNKRLKGDLRIDEQKVIQMSITTKYQMMKYIQGYTFFMIIIFVLGAVCAWWGFSSITERPLVNVSVSAHTTIAWVAVGVATIGFLTCVFLFYVLVNTKKHIIKLTEMYKNEYPDANHPIY